MGQVHSAILRQVEEFDYLEESQSGSRRGVLVLHAWWGLTDFLKGFCHRLAGEDFTVLAPDLYHGAVATTIEQAKKLRSKLRKEDVQGEIIRAASRLSSITAASIQRIGVVGFSLGGYYALWLADQPNSPSTATVVFYGSRPGEYSASPSAYQFHLAENDPYVSVSGIKKLQKRLAKAGRPAEFYTYPGTSHWFFEADRQDAYQSEAAKLAWERTVAFLRKNVP